jgi:hypothetical protein
MAADTRVTTGIVQKVVLIPRHLLQAPRLVIQILHLQRHPRHQAAVLKVMAPIIASRTSRLAPAASQSRSRRAIKIPCPGHYTTGAMTMMPTRPMSAFTQLTKRRFQTSTRE